RTYNARLCKASLIELQPLPHEFFNNTFNVVCKPQFELSKAVQKKNKKYVEDYSNKAGKLILSKINRDEFKDLDANVLELQLNLNEAGELIDVNITHSSGFSNIDNALVSATKTVGAFSKPQFENFRTNAQALPKEISFKLSFLLGKKYRNLKTQDAVIASSLLGTIGIQSLSIMQNIMQMAR
ncbi:MAG: hypothetical protein LW817_05910, partial [Candidatus Caenarcaniphilales bacterium]|nr:hypothetical protein [Candidatus Caenarcaniphilales bacterium]